MDTNNKMYRVSAKALIFDEQRKLLLVKEKDGRWELPGGGIEHGESPQETIIREIKEECGFDVATVSTMPSFVWSLLRSNGIWVLLIAYETTAIQGNFVQSNEAVEYRFVSIKEMEDLTLHPNIQKLPELLKKQAEK